MVIDRCTTSSLLVFLSLAFPRWAIVFQVLIALDFSSHYMHMYAILVGGGADSSHKKVDKSQSWLLNLYYSNKNVLFIVCALNELFFIALYLLSFSSPLPSPHPIENGEATSVDSVQPSSIVNTSFWRQIFPDPFSAGALEIARVNTIDSFWLGVMVRISFPIMAAKQFINVIQLIKASKWLAEVDIKSRETQGLTRKFQAKCG